VVDCCCFGGCSWDPFFLPFLFGNVPHHKSNNHPDGSFFVPVEFSCYFSLPLVVSSLFLESCLISSHGCTGANWVSTRIILLPLSGCMALAELQDPIVASFLVGLPSIE
jgi:hypothetical protein